MIAYETYKLVHLAMIFVVISNLAIQFFVENPPKYVKIIGGISTLLIFVAGMGLIARLGIPHGEGWPMWIKIKIGLWVLIAGAGASLGKRLRSHRPLAFGVILSLFVLTAMVAIYKPFGA